MGKTGMFPDAGGKAVTFVIALSKLKNRQAWATLFVFAFIPKHLVEIGDLLAGRQQRLLLDKFHPPVIDRELYQQPIIAAEIIFCSSCF
jgi:hypothetical protein